MTPRGGAAAPQNSAPLGQLTVEQFLRDYWQREPVLIRQAISGFSPPIDADELAGLACEAAIESRIIRGHSRRANWQVEHGPFDEARFASLGEQDWTLLVQAVDQHIAEVATLRNRFRFIPDWRLDDVMVSFAAPNGSVGPHYDQYDVFLLQGEGRRRWQVGQRCDSSSPLLPHDELRLLAHFTPTDEYILEPGDMLYLPPAVAHWGIAIDPCTTFSIGFRAPSHADIVSHFCDDLLQRLDVDARYRDPGLTVQENPGLIGDQVTDQLVDVLAPMLSRERIADWFSRYITEPKYQDYDVSCPSREKENTAAHTQAPLNKVLHLPSRARSAYRVTGDRTVLYVDGIRYSCGDSDVDSPNENAHWHQFVTTLCADRRIDPRLHRHIVLDPQLRAIIQKLQTNGALSPLAPDTAAQPDEYDAI